MRDKRKHPLRFYFTAIAVLTSALIIIFFTKPQNSPQSVHNNPETDISDLLNGSEKPDSPPESISDQPLQTLDAEIVPTLTLGLPAQYPMPNDMDPAGKLRSQYQNAIRSGRWPDPALQIVGEENDQKTELPTDGQAHLLTNQSEQSTTIHIVKTGQSLSMISKIYYGTTTRWRMIYDANKKTIGPDPDKLKQDQKLIIPKSPD